MDSKDRAVDIEARFEKVKSKVWDHARNETQAVLDQEQEIMHSSRERREERNKK